MSTVAAATRKRREMYGHEQRLKVRRELDLEAQFAGMIDFDHDLPRWEDMAIDNKGDEMALPFRRVLQGFKALALENASLKRMMRN